MSYIQSGIGYPNRIEGKSDKRLLFPKFEDFVSFNQYVLSLNSHVDALLSMDHTNERVFAELSLSSKSREDMDRKSSLFQQPRGLGLGPQNRSRFYINPAFGSPCPLGAAA